MVAMIPVGLSPWADRIACNALALGRSRSSPRLGVMAPGGLLAECKKEDCRGSSAIGEET